MGAPQMWHAAPVALMRALSRSLSALLRLGLGAGMALTPWAYRSYIRARVTAQRIQRRMMGNAIDQSLERPSSHSMSAASSSSVICDHVCAAAISASLGSNIVVVCSVAYGL